MEEDALEPIGPIELCSGDDSEPLRLLEITADAVSAFEPLLGQFAKLCVEVAKERRLEIEARLAARLGELSRLFGEIEARRASEVADRELQFQSLSVLLEIAKASGDPALISEAMRCFKEYVRAAPALTRDFSEAWSAIEPSLQLFPPVKQQD